VPKIQKPESGIIKLKRSDIKWSNLCGDQDTQFVGYIKSHNANNSCNNRKNTRTTSDVGPPICVSFAKEGKTQVKWVVVVR
jgi:hypothetical protein